MHVKIGQTHCNNLAVETPQNHAAKLFKYVWTFFNIMHERINSLGLFALPL